MGAEIIGLAIAVGVQVLTAGVIIGVMQANQRHTAAGLNEVKTDVKELKIEQGRHAEEVAKVRERVAVHDHILGVGKQEFQLHQ
jgi:hypothetical protein